MVESLSKENTTTYYKSLSADSELNSGYDLLYKGEYNQCARIIKKKFKKLKNPIDKANFNILKLLLLHRTKKTKEKNALLDQLKQEFQENSDLNQNQTLVKHFKNILRSFNDEKGAQDLFKVQLKSMNLNSLDFKAQKDVLEELTMNFDFREIYTKTNGFIKNATDENVNFLKLIKYEMVYYMFKKEILKERSTLPSLTEMLANYDTLKKEKGFLDILGQFTFSLGQKDKFQEIFIQKKTDNELTNVPYTDIIYDILLEQEKFQDILNKLYTSIKTNIDKCIFNDYERIINVCFWYFSTKEIKLSIDKALIINDVSNIKENISNLGDSDSCNTIISDIMTLFEYVKVNSGRNLNTFKSGVLGQLMIYHNIIGLMKVFNDDIQQKIFDLIISLLDKAITKQSIIFEISKYFIYLNDSFRKKLISYYEEKFKLTVFSECDLLLITKDSFDNFLFMQKLYKLLFKIENSQKNISYLFKSYLHVNKTITVGTKLEKGERNISDDLILLADEIYFEDEENKANTPLSFALLVMNIIAHENSPHNYDISYYLLKIYGCLNINSDCLDLLKFMNLKGPQFETVSYIAFLPFINYKNGLNYLIDNSEHWQNDNNRNSSKTLWKMFSNGNFWWSNELIEFLAENKNSYYTILLQFFDAIISINENYLNNPSGTVDTEAEKDYYDFFMTLYNTFIEKKNKNELIKNQDMFVTMHKYKYNNYIFFNNEFSKLTTNQNYSKGNYRYEIDRLNKNNNCLYEYYPGYKNNFIPNCGISPFGKYDSYEYLILKMLNIITLNYFSYSNYEELKKYTVLYKQAASDLKSELDEILVNYIELIVSAVQSVNDFNKNINNVYEQLSKIQTIIVSKISEFKNGLSFDKYNKISTIVNEFGEMKYFYFVPFTLVTGKLLDFVLDHKKEIEDMHGIKAKINEKYKSPIINMLKELSKVIEELNGNCHKEGFEGSQGGKTISDLVGDIDEKIVKKANDMNYKIDQAHKDVFKEIKDYCKKIEDYIKQKI